MSVLAHTRDGVVVRGRDLYDRWAAEMELGHPEDRPAVHWVELPTDVQRAWNVLAHSVQEAIACA